MAENIFDPVLVKLFRRILTDPGIQYVSLDGSTLCLDGYWELSEDERRVVRELVEAGDG